MFLIVGMQVEHQDSPRPVSDVKRTPRSQAYNWQTFEGVR